MCEGQAGNAAIRRVKPPVARPAWPWVRSSLPLFCSMP